MRANRELFLDKYKSIRHLFLESGLQFLAPKEHDILESYYRYFDPKLKGEVSLKSFSKTLRKLNVSWSESEISLVFHDYNSSFQAHASKKGIGYHTLLLAMIGNMDAWLGKTVKNAAGLYCEKDWIKRCFNRRLLKGPEEDFGGMGSKELAKKLMGREEDVEEENAAEGKEVKTMKHFEVDDRCF